MSSLILSDLHLPATASPLREAFIEFLEGPAREAKQVFILGDLFEYWIGDDVGMQVYAREVSALAALSALGVQVFFMHGNRDFLVGKAFADITGAVILRDPLVVEIEGRPTLLSHGDLWCTADRGYQRWRRFSRNPLTQALYRLLPRSLRERIAGGVRAQSDQQKRYKPEDIMDVSAESIERAFVDSGVARMIHGHTHRPAEHVHDIGGRRCERIVLADWRLERMESLQVDASGCTRITL